MVGKTNAFHVRKSRLNFCELRRTVIDKYDALWADIPYVKDAPDRHRLALPAGLHGEDILT